MFGNVLAAATFGVREPKCDADRPGEAEQCRAEANRNTCRAPPIARAVGHPCNVPRSEGRRRYRSGSKSALVTPTVVTAFEKHSGLTRLMERLPHEVRVAIRRDALSTHVLQRQAQRIRG